MAFGDGKGANSQGPWRETPGPRRRGPAYFALVGGTLAVFLGGAHVAATALIEAQRTSQLEDLSETALRRSEVAVDYGIAALDELHDRGPMTCDPVALQIVRLHVYQRGTVKDIRAVNPDGSVICSAYSETLEFDKGWARRDEMLPAGDGDVRLFRVEQFFGVALGIQKDFPGQNSLVAILGINSYLYDIMPTELREHSEVRLTLADGKAIARFPAAADGGDSGEAGGWKPSEAAVTFTNESGRYPLAAALHVDAEALRHWHREPYLPIMALGGVLGLAFGVLVASAATRPKSPIAELDEALARGELRPYMQPLFELRTGAIIGCEVLARWIRADGTMVPSSRFIPLAEGSGRVVPMTWQIMAEALRELRPWLARDPGFKVSVNVVPDHFASPGFVEDLRRVVSQAQVAPAQVVLELTERQELADPARVAATIRELHALRFRVALDDVGIGHNGLSHIQQLGASALKIDKFFVDSVGRDPAATPIVEMLVRLARELDMTVLAEGIESPDQANALMRCGVEEGQGYLCAPAMAPAEFIRFLADRTAETRRRLDVAGAA